MTYAADGQSYESLGSEKGLTHQSSAEIPSGEIECWTTN